MRLILSTILATGVALAPCDAQSPTTWQREALYAHAWPETVAQSQQLAGSQLQARSAGLVRFDAAARVDAVVLRAVEVVNNEIARGLFLLRDVARAHACVPLGAAVDFAVVPCGPGQQGVLALQADGALRLHRWPTGQNLPSSTLVGTWPGYRRLAFVRGATQEVIGFDFAGLRIRRAQWTGAQVGVASTVTTLANISFVDAMDWNGDGVSELLLGSASATYVSAWSAALLDSLPIGGPSGSVTLRCVSRASTGDHLVTCVWDGANALLSWGNATAAGALPLAGFAPAMIVAFDRDADGDDDLVLADATRGALRLLVREPNGYRQEAASLAATPTQPDVGIGAVAAGDIDGDRDGDVLAWQRGTMRTHTLLDDGLPRQRPVAIYGDVFGASVGQTVQLGVAISLPQGFALLHPAGAAFHLQIDGWLVDPATGFVRRQRALSMAIPVGSEQGSVFDDVEFTPIASGGQFHLQLQAALVATTLAGEARTLPSLMLHLTNDALAEQQLRVTVADERIGGGPGKGKGDGGGDGNIVGTKTGKHQISEPPE